MQVSEADDEGESDTKGRRGPHGINKPANCRSGRKAKKREWSRRLRLGSLDWGRQWRRFGWGDAQGFVDCFQEDGNIDRFVDVGDRPWFDSGIRIAHSVAG